MVDGFVLSAVIVPIIGIIACFQSNQYVRTIMAFLILALDWIAINLVFSVFRIYGYSMLHGLIQGLPVLFSFGLSIVLVIENQRMDGITRTNEDSKLDILSFITSILVASAIILSGIIISGISTLRGYPELFIAALVAPLILFVGSYYSNRLIMVIGTLLSSAAIIISLMLTIFLQNVGLAEIQSTIIRTGLAVSLLPIIVIQIRLISSRRSSSITLPNGKEFVSKHFSKIRIPSSRTRIVVESGYDIAGENLKLAIKVSNHHHLAILNVTVNVDVPESFEFVRDTIASQKIGNIAGESFQSAIFWLRPMRCIDDEYGGVVTYRDVENKSHIITIPPKRIVNVCPMLGPTLRADDVFKKLKFGSMKRNCSSFKFAGPPKTVFSLADSRLKGLAPVDRSEDVFNDGTYLGYSCYVGQTKYSEEFFAVEIQASGISGNGVLTLTVYSEDDRILSGFFSDVLPEVRKHIEVLEEQTCSLATCSKCGASIDSTSIGNNRIYRCPYCGALSKVAPWLI
ncbi:MAG: hypothetical protein ACTSWQ_00045 [Candidatus Thorarchaeota archaeon]